MTVHAPIDRIAALAPRLAPLLGKMASDHDGEILASVRAIRRLLERHGLTLNDLGAAIAAEPVRVVYRDRQPEPDPAAEHWREMAAFCASRAELLNEREAAFVANMARILRRPGAEPTPKQAAWLAAIYERLTEEIS